MNKLVLSVLGVLTMALLVWALMPADEPPGPDVTAAPAPSDPAGAADPAEAADPRAPAPSAAGEPTARPAPQPAGDTPPRLAPPRLLPPLVPLPEGEVRPPDQARYGRKPDSPMPRVDPAIFKATVRRYYGNLPRTGRMPARITVEELFPPALYEGLNVPPRSQVVEIGHHPATGPEGLIEALEAPDDTMSTFGVTVVTPDGQRVRDYVQLTTEVE